MKDVLSIRFFGRIDYEPNDPQTLIDAMGKFAQMKKLAVELGIDGDWNNKTQRVQSKKRGAKSAETEGETENATEEKKIGDMEVNADQSDST